MATELKELKGWVVGQAVLVSGGGGMGNESIRQIERITDGRNGTIYVNKDTYDIHGYQRGTDVWRRSHIKPATEEDRLRIKGKNARMRLSKVNWLELDPIKAIHLEEIINANGIETRATRTT